MNIQKVFIPISRFISALIIENSFQLFLCQAFLSSNTGLYLKQTFSKWYCDSLITPALFASFIKVRIFLMCIPIVETLLVFDQSFSHFCNHSTVIALNGISLPPTSSTITKVHLKNCIVPILSSLFQFLNSCFYGTI